MVKRFPEEKKVLLESAAGCIERKAYSKGLDYLDRARCLDRLDPAIPTTIVVARRRLARQQFEQGRADKARKTLEPIEEFLNDNPADLQCSRWTALMRRGLFEQMFGNPAEGAIFLSRARAAAPFPAAFLFFAHITHRQYSRQQQAASPFLTELRSELKQAPSASRAAVLLRLFHYWDQSDDGFSDTPSLDAEANLLKDYLNRALKQPFSRAEAREVVELCDPKSFDQQARSFVNAMLRRDRLDPWFRLTDYMLHEADAWVANPDFNRTKLQSILDEARRRGDQELVPKLQRFIKDLDRPSLPPFPFPGGPDFAADDNDFDDDDDDDFDDEDDADDDLPEGLPNMPPGMDGELTAVLNALAGASDAEIRELRKSLGRDMPEFIFDMLVKAAKTGAPPLLPPMPSLPPRPPRAKRPETGKPKPPPRAPDRNQGELF
jgi:hypothetical protein